MNRLAHVFVVLVAAALASACGAAKPSKYYALDLPEGVAGAGGLHDVALLVGRISAPHLYRDERLVYRTGATQIGTYEYHRWAEPPPEMMEAILLRMLRASGRYRTVQRQASNTRGDFILRGRLHQFEELSGPSVNARVTFELELYDLQSGTAVWTHFYSREEPVGGKEVPDVVQALNRNVQRGLAEATASLDQFFASRAAK
jgi:ABC-type uncharacterized transport system auxiliary subunit